MIDGAPAYYTYNEANQLETEKTAAGTTYYHYDGCGNTTAKQAAGGTTYHQYNTENLLTRIDFAAGGGHAYYTYDGDSKRVSQRTADGYTGFVYQGPDMLALQLERNEAGTTQAHYTIGQGLESVRRSTTSHFYHYNHLGTTLALTASNQTVSDTYTHDAWGVLLSSTGSTVNPHTYVGRERYYLMSGADLYHLGFRDYNQALGRFMTVDPAAANPSYCYVDGRSTLLADARGLWEKGTSHRLLVCDAWNNAWWTVIPGFPYQKPGFTSPYTWELRGYSPWVFHPFEEAPTVVGRCFMGAGNTRRRGWLVRVLGRAVPSRDMEQAMGPVFGHSARLADELRLHRVGLGARYMYAQ